MRQARFFEYHVGVVRIKINEGETIHHSHGGRTDEGFHWEAKRFSFDGETLVCEWMTKSRDCDGLYERGGVATCRADQLAAGFDDAENGVRFPAWEAQNDDGYQRDHSAEAMNY